VLNYRYTVRHHPAPPTSALFGPWWLALASSRRLVTNPVRPGREQRYGFKSGAEDLLARAASYKLLL